MTLLFRVEFCFRFSAQIFGVSNLIIIISSSSSNRLVIVEVVVLKEMNTLLLFSKDAFK